MYTRKSGKNLKERRKKEERRTKKEERKKERNIASLNVVSGLDDSFEWGRGHNID